MFNSARCNLDPATLDREQAKNAAARGVVMTVRLRADSLLRGAAHERTPASSERINRDLSGRETSPCHGWRNVREVTTAGPPH